MAAEFNNTLASQFELAKKNTLNFNYSKQFKQLSKNLESSSKNHQKIMYFLIFNFFFYPYTYKKNHILEL